MENIKTSFEIQTEVITEKLSMFLEDRTRSYANMFIDTAMKKMLDEIDNLQDMRVFGNILSTCKLFAERHQLQDLLDSCATWNTLGIEKAQALVSKNNEKENTYDIQSSNSIKIQLQTFYKILTAPMKDMDAIYAIRNQLNDFSEIIANNGNELFSPEEIDKVKTLINQEIEMANSIILISDEFDEDLKIR